MQIVLQIFNLNYRAMRDYRPFFDHHDTILHRMGAIIAIFQFFSAAVDLYVIAYISVFIDDGILDAATITDAHNRRIGRMRLVDLLQRLVIIIAHDVAILDNGILPDTCTDADNGAVNMTGADDTTVGYQSFLQVCTRYF